MNRRYVSRSSRAAPPPGPSPRCGDTCYNGKRKTPGGPGARKQDRPRRSPDPGSLPAADCDRVPRSTRRISVMSTTVSIDEGQATLKELIQRLAPGDEVIILEDHVPVAKLVSQHSPPVARLRPPPGLGKGIITVTADDEEHLSDFGEYMP